MIKNGKSFQKNLILMEMAKLILKNFKLQQLIIKKFLLMQIFKQLSTYLTKTKQEEYKFMILAIFSLEMFQKNKKLQNIKSMTTWILHSETEENYVVQLLQDWMMNTTQKPKNKKKIKNGKKFFKKQTSREMELYLLSNSKRQLKS